MNSGQDLSWRVLVADASGDHGELLAGRVEEWRDVPIDQYTWLMEGEGR